MTTAANKVAEVIIRASGDRRSSQGPGKKTFDQIPKLFNFWATETFYTSKKELQISYSIADTLWSHCASLSLRKASIYGLSLRNSQIEQKRNADFRSKDLHTRGWVPKFATGIYINIKNVFIFNFLTGLDYKHKN